MRFAILVTLPIAFSLGLAACSEPEADAPIDTGEGMADEGVVLDPTDQVVTAPVEEGPVASAVDEPIPPVLHGRWGLTAQDCALRNGRAQGLLTVAGNGLEFYESTATVQRIVSQETDQFHAIYDLRSEGMEQKRGIMLDLDDGRLIRRDFDETGAQTYTYERCR